MKINYYLRKNHLSTSDENRYVACVQKKEPIYQEDLIKDMLRKNTTVTRQDILVVMDLLKESVMDNLLLGFPIYSDLFKAGISIRGGFSSSYDEIDPAKHQLSVNLNASSDLKKQLLKRAELDTVRYEAPSPSIREIYDYGSNENSLNFTRGSLIHIRGNHLYVEGQDSTVWLSVAGSNEMISLPNIHKSTKTSILCNLPEDIEAGSYELTVINGDGVNGKAKRGTYSSEIHIT